MKYAMKRILIVAAVVLMAGCQAQTGKIVTDSIRSEVLGAEVTYNVYLPAGYSESGAYPIVYLLHGLTDDYTAWVDKGHMQVVVDSLVAAGQIVDVVIVMPNAGGPDIHNTWNGYFNMPGWNYEDFFFGEFIPAVEAKYHAIGDREHRAVMGLSMGGGGSVVYAQRHPDMFASCFAMSPWLDNNSGELKPGEEKDCFYHVCTAVHEHSALDFVDAADETTLEALRSVRWFVDCGDDDFLLSLSMDFYRKMRALDIPCELRIRDGVHNWDYWYVSLGMALPFALL